MKPPGWLDRALVAVAARLVPAERRCEWQREWLAELAHRRRSGRVRPAWAGTCLRDALELRRLAARPRAGRRRLRGAASSPANAEGFGGEPPRLEGPRVGGSFLDGFRADLRTALRGLRRAPGYAAAVVLLLGLGIGANATIFSVVHGVVLSPLPFPDAGELVTVWERSSDGEPSRVALANYVDWRRQAESFDELAVLGNSGATLTGGAEPLQVSGTRVSASYFSVLGVQPILGRAFRPEEDFAGPGPGPDAVVILSEGLWRSRFGADRDILGETIFLDGARWRVIGVMPDGRYPTRAPTQATLPLEHPTRHVWVPLFLNDQWSGNRRSHVFAVIGRLKDGASLEAAQAEMDGIAARLAEAYPEFNAGEGALVRSLHEEVVGDVRPPLLLLLGAVGFVLAIACANAAGLLVARATARRHEVAIRAALGAPRWRLLRHDLVESLVLALAGGGFGVVLARWGVGAVRAAAPPGIPRLEDIGVDGAVLAFSLVATLLAGLLLGLVPSLRPANRAPSVSLRQSARGSSAGRDGLRRALVVCEVAIAVILVIGAGLVVRSFWNLVRVDPGFEPRGVLEVSLVIPPAQNDDRVAVTGFYGELLQRLGALPGVVSVAAAYDDPLSAAWIDTFRIADRPVAESEERSSGWLRIVTPDYFRTLGVRLLRGRTFTPDDRAGAAGAVIVNESFARRFFAAEEALGQRLEIGTPARMWTDGLSPELYEIVGVVDDVRFLGVERPAEPAFYLPFAQFPQFEQQVLIRTASDPLALAAAVREQVWAIDPDQPVAAIATLSGLLDESLAARRFHVGLLGLFGGAALALAAIGLYGLLAYAVVRRRREIGVRMAVGADAYAVVRLVVRQGMVLVAAGAALGVVGAMALTRLMESLLFAVSARDPLVFTATVLFLGLVTLVACWLPARRAAHVDPVVALRSD